MKHLILFENFGRYLFNGKVVNVTNVINYGQQYKVDYYIENINKKDSVLLDSESEFEELFEPFNSSPKPQYQYWDIIYQIGNKTEYVKRGIADQKLAYGIRGNMMKEPQFKDGNLRVVKSGKAQLF